MTDRMDDEIDERPAGRASAESDSPCARDVLAREIRFREWLASFPELFQTSLQYDCFLQIALLTLEGDRLPTLKMLYRRLPHSENAVRSHLRALANGGWIRLQRADSGDRRIVALQIEPRFKQARDVYFQRAQRAANDASAEPLRYRA
jgi:hypothetical protein